MEKDFVELNTSVEEFLLALLEKNPHNRMAFELLMAHYLAVGRPDGVAAWLPRLKDFSYPGIPRLYQEAAIIQARSTGKRPVVPGYELDAAVLARADQFASLAAGRGAKKGRRRRLLQRVLAIPTSSIGLSAFRDGDSMRWILDRAARLARRILHGSGESRYGLILAATVAALVAATAWAVWDRRPDVDGAVAVPRPPRISPDYSGIVIPPNIAPLNFTVQERGRRFLVRIRAEMGEPIEVVSGGPAITIPPTQWRRLLQANRGHDLEIEVYAEAASRWERYQRFVNRIAQEESTAISSTVSSAPFTTAGVRRPSINAT